MADLKIVTDSGCDLDKELLAKYGVDMLPISVQIGDKEYKDRVNIQPAEFYRQLEQTEELPVTSQITPYTLKQRFESLLQQNDQLIYISFSSQLSGIYNSAQLAQQMIASDRITVIDSKSASGGQGLLVLKAAELARKKETAKEVVSVIESKKERVKHIFRVGSLEMLKKGGRISSAKAFLGSLLNINPILEVDETGKIVPLTKVKGKEKALEYLVKAISEQGSDLEQQRIVISHADASRLAENLADQIRSRREVKEILITKIGAAIGSHAGPGTLALFYQ